MIQHSFIPVSADSPFPMQNLPYGVFTPPGADSARVGVAIGDYVLANFRRKHLFWTTGHVCNEALGVLAKRLYKATLPLLAE